MKKERMGAIRRRLGPLGMSLAAAAVTATAFAAISLADNDNKGGKDKDGDEVMRAAVPGPGAPGVMMFRERLSEEDQQKLEEFRQCMEDNGAPAPPRLEEVEPGDGPPKPPSEADREKIEKALEACEDKLPEGLPGPHFGGPGCAPPPGAQEQGQGDGESRQGSSYGTGVSSSAAAA